MTPPTAPLDAELAGRVSSALGEDALLEEDGRPVGLRPRGREGLRRSIEILTELRCPWCPEGGRRRADPGGRVRLSTVGHGAVLDLWPEDLVARVGAGSTLRELESALAPLGVRPPVSAVFPERATLGGIFAAGERGARGGPNHGLRESVLGLTAVDGSGRLLKAGGRVVKNVAGYDLCRLFHGAAGALGLVLDLVIKLEPIPESGIGRAFAADAGRLFDLLETVRRPASLLDPSVQLWIDGDGLLPGGPSKALLCLAEGWDESVRGWSSSVGGEAWEPAEVDPFEMAWQGDGRTLWRWLTHPSAALRRWGSVAPQLEEAGLDPALVLDLQSGHGLIALSGEGIHPALTQLVDAGEAMGGSLWLERAAGRPGSALGRPEPGRRGAIEAVESRIKESFDPLGLLPAPPRPWEFRR